MTDRRFWTRRTNDAMLDRRVARADMIARVMLSGLADYVVMAAKTGPDTVAQLMVESQGFSALVVIGLLACCSLLIKADVLINDWLPRGYTFSFARDNRRWIYFVAAWLCLLPAFTATTAGLTRPSATFLYLLMAASGVALGFRDALSIRRARQCAG